MPADCRPRRHVRDTHTQIRVCLTLEFISAGWLRTCTALESPLFPVPCANCMHSATVCVAPINHFAGKPAARPLRSKQRPLSTTYSKCFEQMLFQSLKFPARVCEYRNVLVSLLPKCEE